MGNFQQISSGWGIKNTKKAIYWLKANTKKRQGGE
jgi:hypothetical protein